MIGYKYPSDQSVSTGSDVRSHHWPQIFACISVCYVCISGGNILGYTSSAIISMRNENAGFYTALFSGSSGDSLGRKYRSDQFEQNFIRENNESQLSGPAYKGFEKRVGNSEFNNLTNNQASWIGGCAPLGAFMGSVLAAIFLKYLGHRGTVLYACSPIFILSWFLTAFAPTLQIIYAARLLGGIAMGMSVPACTVYICETAPLHLRGALGTLPQILITAGILVSFVLGNYFNWRECAFLSAILVAPSFLMLFYTPESPTWLLLRNRESEAQDAFYRLSNTSSESDLKFLELKEETYSTLVYGTKPRSVKSRLNSDYLFSIPNLKSSLSALGVAIFQQISGINGIRSYTVSIFEAAKTSGPMDADDSSLSGHLSSIIVAVVQFCATLLCFVLIENLGRKVLLTFSIGFMGISTLLLGFHFYSLNTGSSEWSWLPLVCLVIFVLAFSIGQGPVCFIYVAEVLPTEIRDIVNPLAVGVNWLAVFIVAKSFHDIVGLIGEHGAFWMYSLFSFIGLIFTIFMVPETKGKNEKEIQSYFIKNPEECVIKEDHSIDSV